MSEQRLRVYESEGLTFAERLTDKIYKLLVYLITVGATDIITRIADLFIKLG